MLWLLCTHHAALLGRHVTCAGATRSQLLTSASPPTTRVAPCAVCQAARLSGLAYYSPVTHLCWHPTYGPWFALRAVVVADLEGPPPAQPVAFPYANIEVDAAALMQQLVRAGGPSASVEQWRRWAELRALGARYTDPQHAYCAEQLEYHYTRARGVLVAAVEQHRREQQGAVQGA